MENALEEWRYWEDAYHLTYRFGCCTWRLPSCLLWGLHSCPWRLPSCLLWGLHSCPWRLSSCLLWDFTAALGDFPVALPLAFGDFTLDLPLDSDDSMQHTGISGTLGDFLAFPTFDLGFCFNCLTHCNIKIWLESVDLWESYTGKGEGIQTPLWWGKAAPSSFSR